MPDEQEIDSLSSDENLLALIRNRFDYVQDAWQDIRREGDQDMRYVSGNPWPEAEKIAREKAGRPCLVMDEISQYTNQLNNEIRQNKRAVKVVPRGYGANDSTADFRGNLIRQIEYKSNAQSAYTCGFENMCNRSYGAGRSFAAMWMTRRITRSFASFGFRTRTQAILTRTARNRTIPMQRIGFYSI